MYGYLDRLIDVEDETVIELRSQRVINIFTNYLRCQSVQKKALSHEIHGP